MRLLKIICLLLVGTCFGLKLSFIESLTDEEEQESQNPVSQAQTVNTTQAQQEQDKAQEQSQEEKDSFADLLKKQDSLETSFHLDKSNQTTLVEKNKTTVSNTTILTNTSANSTTKVNDTSKGNVSIVAKNTSIQANETKNNTAIALQVVKKMKDEQNKKQQAVASVKINSKAIKVKAKNNATKAGLSDFDQSEFEKTMSKLQMAFNMPNIGQQMNQLKQEVEDKKKKEEKEKKMQSTTAEVIAKTLKKYQTSQKKDEEQLPLQLTTVSSGLDLSAEAKIMDPNEYRLMHPFKDEQSLASRLNQWEAGDDNTVVFKLEQEKIKQIQQKEGIYNKQSTLGSDSLLDPKNKDVLIIMAQKEKKEQRDPKLKANKK